MTTLRSGLSDEHKFSFASIGLRAYGANGWDRMFMWDGASSAAEDAGIPVPPQTWAPSPTTASGTSTAGLHHFQYRYKDSVTGYVSDPSNLLAVTLVAGATQATFPVASSGTGNINTSSDGKVDKIVLESTLVNGGVFYVSVEVDNAVGNAVFNISDAVLSEAVLPYDDTGHAQPPIFRCLASHKGRLWGLGSVRHDEGTIAVTNGSSSVVGTGTAWTDAVIARFFHAAGDPRSYEVLSYGSATGLTLTENYAGGTASGNLYLISPKAPNLLFCSKALFPESWPALSFISCLKEMNDTATALVPFANQLLICGFHSMERLTFSLEPFETLNGRHPDGQLFPVSRTRGAFNPQSVKEVEGKIFGWDHAGVWVWEGGQPKHISNSVDSLLRSAITRQHDKMPHISWHGDKRKIRFHYGDTANLTSFVELDVDKGEWVTGTHFSSMLSSTEYNAPDAGNTAIYGDSNGWMWAPDQTAHDGVMAANWADNPTQLTTVVGTVAASPPPSSTVFTITEGSLDAWSGIYPADASFTGMAGAPCFSVGLSQEDIVLSNTATVVTLKNGFSTAPAAGTKIYFGTIWSVLFTRQFILDDQWDKTRPRYVHIHFIPPGGLSPTTNATNTIGLEIVPDPSGIAFTDWQTYSENGVAFTAGSSRIEVLMDSSGTGSEGYRRIPIGSKSWRYLALRLSTYKPNEDTSIYGTTVWPAITGIDVDGYTSASPVDVV